MRRLLLALMCAMGSPMTTIGSTERHCCAVLELRQYTLKPGRRDSLIDLFERHFIESQEATGMTLVGQFRDRRRADRFVWLRGFADMESRRRSLEAFYGGPVWTAHRDSANDTMVDSDDVLLLKPAREDLAFRADALAVRATAQPLTALAGIYYLPQPVDADRLSRFERRIAPILRSHGVRLEAIFVTESAPNTFPRLPVRADAHVLVWFGTIGAGDIANQWEVELTGTTALDGQPVSLLVLDPTPRSILGNGPHAARASKHDFDFLFGAWNVHNRHLTERLRHSTEWIEFDARADVQPHLDGFGHVDRYRAVRDGTPFEGITLRLFNPATGEWSLHWADTVRARTLLPPMVGRFTGEAGEFFGEETADGRRVLCRFRWTRVKTHSPRWEQAFSADDGRTWETNWIMTLTRP